MKYFTLSFLMLISFMFVKTESGAATCNWKSKITNFYTWDSCSGTKASLNGYVTLNTKGCFIYQWKVNSANVGTNYPAINYRITQNGTYTLCVKVTDTCNKCDTTLCSTFTITCFNKCNWKGLSPSFVAYDTCKGTGGVNSITAYLSLSSRNCQKYVWTVNGVTQSTKNYYLNYKVTSNGTYVVCIKAIDTCKNCDTTFCSTRTFTCFSTTKCVWKPKTSYYFWDTCKGNGGRNSLNAYVSLKTGSCYKYQWTVNNTPAGNGNILNYNIYNNGTYNVCVKVTDTCNKCDTTICSARTISCFTGNCNWAGLSPYLWVKDSCGSGGGSYISTYLNINNRNCQKYTWTVNGVPQQVNTYYYKYNVTANGTYTVCLKVKDTCKNCDTTFCVTKTFSCMPSCNWKSKISNFYAWDSCKGSGSKNSLNAYIAFKTSGCYKYQWKVNNAYAGNGNVMKYNIFNNGTYNVCVKVTDTCNNCDTVLCSTRTITCFGSSTKCNFKARTPYFYAWDTCRGSSGASSVNAYISFQSFYCLKYVWTVNGVTQNNKSNILHYPVTSNGTYIICVKVIDSCNNCDTTICSTRTITCFSTSKCNWKGKISSFYTWDTCKGAGARNSVNGYIAFKTSGCYKYQWKVNNVNAGKGFIMHYPINANGTYNICVKITDTCNNCDTTLCATKTLNCFSKPCNFKARGPSLVTWDSCIGSNAAVLGYISFNNSACLKYSWTVAGVAAGTGPYLIAPIYKNGTYAICVKVVDTCNSTRCDTTICVSRTINCNGLGIGASANLINNINVYPNPVSDILNIEYSGDKAQVEVSTMLGELMYSGELTGDKKSIRTDSWSNGIYMVRINTGEGSGYSR